MANLSRESRVILLRRNFSLFRWVLERFSALLNLYDAGDIKTKRQHAINHAASRFLDFDSKKGGGVIRREDWRSVSSCTSSLMRSLTMLLRIVNRRGNIYGTQMSAVSI